MLTVPITLQVLSSLDLGQGENTLKSCSSRNSTKPVKYWNQQPTQQPLQGPELPNLWKSDSLVEIFPLGLSLYCPVNLCNHLHTCQTHAKQTRGRGAAAAKPCDEFSHLNIPFSSH